MTEPHRNMQGDGSGDLGPLCLVVGGAGFLGQALVRALLARGLAVRALDRVPFEGDSRVEAITADVRDAEAVRRAAAGCDTVFHTAAVINLVGVCDEATRREVFDINLGGTENVLAACRAGGVPRLVHTSTNSVCFDPAPVEGADERKPYATRFIDVYAESKVAAERAVLAASGRDGLHTVALRPAGLWGPGRCYMLHKFVEELAAGNLVARIGDGRSLSDNTHVENLVHAELLAAARLVTAPEVVGGQAYFITDEEPMNLMEWFRPLVEGLGYRLPRLTIPARLMYGAGYLMEWVHRLGGPRPKMTRLEVHNLTTSFTFRTDRARRELGYRPLLGRDQGLAECLPRLRELLEEKQRPRASLLGRLRRRGSARRTHAH